MPVASVETFVKKKLLKIFVGLLIVLLLLAVAVQVVLWTQMPRNWVLSAIQQKLQLRVSADGLSTGWAGNTVLTNVTMALPLDEESVVQTPRLVVKHTSLLGLIVGVDLEVKSIEIERPNVLLRQRENGQWNVQEVAQLIGRASGGAAAGQSPGKANTPVKLPNVDIRDATIRVINRAGRQVTIQKLAIKGTLTNPLVWEFVADVPDLLHVGGEIAPGSGFAHTAHIQLANLHPVVRPLLEGGLAQDELVRSIRLDATWSGKVSPALSGRLDLAQLSVSGFTMTGPVNVTTTDGGATITPVGLVVTPPAKDAIPPARANSGAIAFNGQKIVADQLSLAFAGGEIRVNADYSPGTNAGKAEVKWNRVNYPEGTLASGQLNASVEEPWPGQPVVGVKVSTTAEQGADRLDAEVALSGKGASWTNIDWTVETPRLIYHTGGETYNLNGTAVHLTTRGDVVALKDLSVPEGNLYREWKRGTLTGTGAYDRGNGKWHAYVTGDNWPVSTKANSAAAPASFLVNVGGDRVWLVLRQVYLKTGGLVVWGDGHVAYAGAGKPVEFNLYATYPPVEYTWHEKDGNGADDVKFSGTLNSELHVTKGAWPIDMDIHGALYARHFRAGSQAIGDVTMQLEGKANPNGVHVETTRLKLLGGEWLLSSDYFFQKQLMQTNLTLWELPLEQLDVLSQAPRLKGTMSGQWNFQVPEFDIKRLAAQGEYSIKNLARVQAAATTMPTTMRAATTAAVVPEGDAQARNAGGTPAPQMGNGGSVLRIADLISGKIDGYQGRINFDPIDIRLKDGQLLAKVSFPIDSPRHMKLTAKATAWPVEFPDAKKDEPSNVVVWLDTDLDLNLRRRVARGPMTMRAVVSAREQLIADMTLDARVDQRTLRVNSIKGSGLGGTIAGNAVLEGDDVFKSAGRVEWQDVDSASLTALAPTLKGLTGRYSGTVDFGPNSGEWRTSDAPPFSVKGEIKSNQGAYKEVQLGDISFAGYGDDHRIVLEKFDAAVAGGKLNLWARATDYDWDRFIHVALSVDKLQLDQIAKAARPAGEDHKPTPGLITGSLTAAGNPFTAEGRRQASGDLSMRVTESDLVNVDIVNALYTLMSVKFGKYEPTGRGMITARLEGPRLEIPVARYFNRGTDIRANAAVVDIFKGYDSPIEGGAAGSARPLKDLKLPFMADVDKVFSALQGSLVAVRLQGTVGKPVPKAIPFNASGETFRRFMLGEVKEEVRGSSE